MSEEVPLSEFVTEEEPDESDGSGSPSAEAQGETTETTGEAPIDDERPVQASTVTPVEATSAYDPAGVTCEGCGETVNRRMHTEEGLRCLECVTWNRGH